MLIKCYLFLRVMMVLPSEMYLMNQYEELTGFTKDYFHKIVGTPRLRQQRVKRNDTCSIDYHFSGLIKQCRSKSLLFNEDDLTYNGSWSVLPINPSKIHESAWKYQTADETQSIGLWGKSGAYYDGGGYIANLSRSRLRSIAILSDLADCDWLDEFTRVVFVEFVLFNVNTNIFSLVTLIGEHLANGVYVTRYQVTSLNLGGELSIGTCIGMMVVLIIVIIMTCRVYYLMELYGFRRYFFKSRNVLNFASSVLGLVLMIMWLVQHILNFLYGKFLKDAASHVFISYYHPIHSKRLMDSLLALFTLLVVLQIIYVVKFDSKIEIIRKCLEFIFEPSLLVCIMIFSWTFILNWIFMLLQNPFTESYFVLISALNYHQFLKGLIFHEKIILPLIFTISCVILLVLIRVIIVYYYTTAKYHNTYHLMYYRDEFIKAFMHKELSSSDDYELRLRAGMDDSDDVVLFNDNLVNVIVQDHWPTKSFCIFTTVDHEINATNVLRINNYNHCRLNLMRLISINFLRRTFIFK